MPLDNATILAKARNCLAIEREVPSVKIRNAEEIWVVGVDVAATRT